MKVGHILDAVDVGGEERNMCLHAHRLPLVEGERVDAHADDARGVAVVLAVGSQPLRRRLAQPCHGHTEM